MSTIRVGGWSDWYLLSTLYMLFHSETVRFPLCAGCRPSFRMRRWGAACLMWGGVALALFLLHPSLQALGGSRERAAVLGVVFSVALVIKLVDFLWPASLDAHLEEDRIHYRFRSPSLAGEFGEMNPPSRLRARAESETPGDLRP